MNENPIFEERKPEPGQMQVHVASLVLGILSIVFSLLIALVGDILGIIGIVLAVKNRSQYKTTAALVCSIIGLVLAVINHILGALVTVAAFL